MCPPFFFFGLQLSGIPSLVSSSSSPKSIGTGGTLSSKDLAPTFSSLTLGLVGSALKRPAARADGGVLKSRFGGESGGALTLGGVARGFLGFGFEGVPNRGRGLSDPEGFGDGRVGVSVR